MLVVLDATLANSRAIRGLSKRFTAARKQALRETAEYWHREILPRHFTPGNITRYQMEPRTAWYKRVRKMRSGVGQGKYVDLTLTGKSKRYLLAFGTVSGTSQRATLRMQAPAYFTRPFIGSFTGKDGRRRTIRRQPDKPDEVVRFDPRDRKSLSEFLQSRLQLLMQQTSG